MRTRKDATIDDLRRAIICLPRRTRIAMLDGIRSNEIIAGAYSEDGGICPMLAAHRAGGRTDCISFAKAWDRFAFRGSRPRGRRARRATARELLVLTSHLEASLLEDDGPAPGLAQAIAEHRALTGRAREPGGHAAQPAPRAGDPETRATARTAQSPGDANRTGELARRPGWAWMRVMRRYDEYERALSLLDDRRTVLEPDPPDDREPAPRRELEPTR